MPSWKKAETIMDFADAVMTAADIISRMFAKEGAKAKVAAAAEAINKNSEKRAEDYADWLKDETKVASMVASIPDAGKRKALRRWLYNLKLNRKRSHVQVILGFAQMTTTDEKLAVEYLQYLGTLSSDDDRNEEMVAYGLMRPNEGDYFGSKMEDAAKEAWAATKKSVLETGSGPASDDFWENAADKFENWGAGVNNASDRINEKTDRGFFGKLIK